MEDPRPPAIPAPSLKAFMSLARGDEANVQVLRLASHTGTHVDAPAHVIEGGVDIHDFLPADLIFTKIAVFRMKRGDAEIVMPEDLTPFAERLRRAEMALFDFGYGKMRREDPVRYSLRSPGFGVEAAEWLKMHCPRLRAVGLDVPSFSVIAHIEKTMKAHAVLLGVTERKMLLIEEMNLEGDLHGLREVRVNPWRVAGMDSGPCSIIGVFAAGAKRRG
jgi:kynurenine formamidase